MVLVPMFSALSASAYDFEANGIYYNILSTDTEGGKKMTCEVTNNGKSQNSYSGKVIVPAEVVRVYSVKEENKYGQVVQVEKKDTYTVVAVGSSAFNESPELTEVQLPESITTIGDNAFRGCTSLIKVNLPKKLTAINKNLFYGCSSLTSVAIPDSITVEIADNAFLGTAIKSLNIPACVNYIGRSAFYDCKDLKKVVVADRKSVV